VPLLRGQKFLGRQAIYWHYPHYGNQGGFPGSVIRMGDYKLIANYVDDSIELYNLKDDIGEKHDLAKKMSKKTRQLKTMLEKWLNEVDAKMPTKNPKRKK
jgi:arylsulfatase A-like enzyme